MGNWDWRKDRAATLRAWVPHVAGKTSSAPVARAPLPGVPSLSGAADKLAGFINPFYQPEGAGSSSFESSLGAPAAAEPEAYTGGAFVKKQFKAPAGGSGPAAAPAGLAQLAAGGGAPGQPVNPLLAAVQKDPTLLAKPVVLGSTTTSNYQRGLKSMPLFQEGLERTAKAQTEAVKAASDAQAWGLEEKAFLSDMRAFEMGEQEVKRQKQQADYKAKVDEFNAAMTAKREEISTAKDLDAGRWWSSRSVGQKIALGLAAALQGFMQGYRGQSGPAPVLSMMERAIDRDLKIQQQNYVRKKGELKDIQGAYGLFRQQGMDDAQALAQTKIGILERYQGKMEGIAATAQSGVLRANAAGAVAGIEQRLLVARNQAYQAAQPRVTSSTTTKKGMLGQLLAAQMKTEKAAKGAAGAPAKRDPREPSPEIKTLSGNINAIRSGLTHFMDEYKKLKLPPGFTTWTGGQADSVEELKKLTIDKIAVSLGMQGAAYLKLLEGQLGSKWSTNRDVVTRIRNLGHALDSMEKHRLKAEASFRTTAPLVILGKKARDRFWLRVGKGKKH